MAGVGLKSEGEALSSCLSENTTLLELDISWNNICNTSAKHVVDGLGANQHLKAINFSHNNLGGSVAVEYLCELLTSAHCSSVLERIDASYNQIGERGACMWPRALFKNERLRWLKLDGNPLGPAGCRAFCTYFSKSISQGKAKRVSLHECNYGVCTIHTGPQTPQAL